MNFCEHFVCLYNMSVSICKIKDTLVCKGISNTVIHIIFISDQSRTFLVFIICENSIGVQQGCPLAPFLFSLVLRDLILKIEAEVPEVKLNLWYLDDGHLAGTTGDLAKCLELIKKYGPPLGLHINVNKCVAYGACLDDLPDEVIRAGDGISVLGSPVGSKEFVAYDIHSIKWISDEDRFYCEV